MAGKDRDESKDLGEGINATLALNLRRVIALRGVTQKQLEAKSGIAQSTISLYVNPMQRQRGASGKEPSAKIAEVSKLADALGVEAWELLRPAHESDVPLRVRALPDEQRKLLDALVETFLAGVARAPAPPPTQQVGRHILAELQAIADPKLAKQAEYRALDAVEEFLNPEPPEPPQEPVPPAPPAPAARVARTTKKRFPSA